jgi:hypothetical protein
LKPLKPPLYCGDRIVLEEVHKYLSTSHEADDATMACLSSPRSCSAGEPKAMVRRGSPERATRRSGAREALWLSIGADEPGSGSEVSGGRSDVARFATFAASPDCNCQP